MAEGDLAQREQGNSASLQGLIRHMTVSRRGAVLLWAAGFFLLLVLAVLAHGAAQFPGDAGIVDALRPLHGTALAKVIDFPSVANQPVPGAVLAFAIIIALVLLRLVIEAIGTMVATFGTDLVNVVINALVARPRPHNAHVQTLGGLGGHSFPSGHVAHVTALFGFLFFLSVLLRRAHPEWWIGVLLVQSVCVYFIALVGIGRIVEGVHQPSDVLAGYLVAALTLPLAITVYYWLGRWWQRHGHAHKTATGFVHARDDAAQPRG